MAKRVNDKRGSGARRTDRFPPTRKSRCADSAFAGEMARMNRMTIEERILEALAINNSFAARVASAQKK